MRSSKLPSVLTLSRHQVQSPAQWSHITPMLGGGPIAVVSIFTPSDSPPEIPISAPTWGIHRECFMDGSPEETLRLAKSDEDILSANSLASNYMTEDQARRIWEFVRDAILNGGVTGIVVHCDAGKSRSRGVAAGILFAMRKDDGFLYRDGHPNAWCKGLIVREAYKNPL